MISIDIEEFHYKPNEKVLQNIHLKLYPGTITSVLGPSGCGKSTLLRILMGFENDTFSLSSRPSLSHGLKALCRSAKARGSRGLTTGTGRFSQHEHSFSLVSQTPYLFPWKTIAQNIALGLDENQRKLNQTEITARIEEILSVVGLAGTQDKYPFEISVGMIQRVSFARAMINSFRVLLLDEPFSSLDALTRRELQNWLLKIIKEQNSYSLFVTHDISEAIYLSKNIYILNKKPGTIIAQFSKEDDSFVEKNTGKKFGSKNILELENTIFELLG